MGLSLRSILALTFARKRPQPALRGSAALVVCAAFYRNFDALTKRKRGAHDWKQNRLTTALCALCKSLNPESIARLFLKCHSQWQSPLQCECTFPKVMRHFERCANFLRIRRRHYVSPCALSAAPCSPTAASICASRWLARSSSSCSVTPWRKQTSCGTFCSATTSHLCGILAMQRCAKQACARSPHSCRMSASGLRRGISPGTASTRTSCA
mmetsp:Transcript_15122/g.40568  ORF Transcript_15122/g.40568 Transcript_15122/m.40568 type:complete len:212 (-) Transcript_15122:31-666(-)